MSNPNAAPLRLALVGEGTTEWEVVEAALKSIVAPRSFVLTQLQPERTGPNLLGNGWGGVLKWCQQQAARCRLAGVGLIEVDPTLSAFDGVVLHLDADVATKAYGDLGLIYTPAFAAAQGWLPLPCPTHCPPESLPADDLPAVLLSWLHPAQPGERTVVCIPAMNTGAWQAAAKLPAGHDLLTDLECNPAIEDRLPSLPLASRVNKRDRKSRLAAAAAVAQRWTDVTARCTRAQAFDQALRTAFP